MKSRIFLFLFALPFFAVGAWMGYSAGSNIHDAWRMQDWIPVDASLTSAGYEVHRGDDSDTFEAYATYRYEFGGQIFDGNRVAIAGGADNIGEHQRDLGNRLQRAMENGRAITVYVNPDLPSESIVNRELRWGLLGFKSIFLFVFGGIGLGLMIWSLRSQKDADLSSPERSERPWLANDDWQTGVIRSSSKTTMWAAWTFTALWNLISAPLPFLVHREVTEKDNTIALVGLLFPLVGAGLLWWAVARTLEWRRFGPAPVTLDPFPGSIGGHVGGMIDVNMPYDPSARFSATLTCLHSYVSGSGDNRGRRENAKWQDTQVAQASSGPNGTRLQFRFDVPDDLPASDADQSSDSYDLWRLNLKAVLPGSDFDRDYEIPVYKTGERSKSLSDFSIESARSDQLAQDLSAIRSRFTIEQGVDGKRMRYPMFRNAGAGIAGCVFGAVFAGAGWFLIDREGHWLMGGIFALVGGLIALAGLYRLFNSLEIVQRGNQIRSVRRLLGIPVHIAEMQRSAFDRFDHKVSMSARSGSKHTVYYKLLARGRAGQTVVLGDGFKGMGQVRAAESLMASELGLTGQGSRSASQAHFGDTNFLVAD